MAATSVFLINALLPIGEPPLHQNAVAVAFWGPFRRPSGRVGLRPISRQVPALAGAVL